MLPSSVDMLKSLQAIKTWISCADGMIKVHTEFLWGNSPKPATSKPQKEGQFYITHTVHILTINKSTKKCAY
jgi:hypothetical protein